MTISIELAPDEEQKLEEKARARGQVVSDYVRELIRKELNGGPANEAGRGQDLQRNPRTHPGRMGGKRLVRGSGHDSLRGDSGRGPK